MKSAIVHFPCSCRTVNTCLSPTNCTIGSIAPTCFACNPQPSSGSYRC